MDQPVVRDSFPSLVVSFAILEPWHAAGLVAENIAFVGLVFAAESSGASWSQNVDQSSVALRGSSAGGCLGRA